MWSLSAIDAFACILQSWFKCNSNDALEWECPKQDTVISIDKIQQRKSTLSAFLLILF